MLLLRSVQALPFSPFTLLLLALGLLGRDAGVHREL
jgi:hypothetical protein